MKKHELEKKIETALNSLEHVTRVGPGPFFYTRVQARLRKDRTAWEKVSAFIAQPAVAFSVICLVISLNTFVIFQTESNSSPSYTEQKNSILSDESDADVFAFYDEENNNTDAQ